MNQLCINEKRRIKKEPIFEIGTNRKILEDSNHKFEDDDEELISKHV